MSYILHLVPWYYYAIALVGLVVLAYLGLLPAVVTLLSRLVAAFKALPLVVKEAIVVAALIVGLVVWYFADVDEKVKAAQSACDAKWQKNLADQRAAQDKQVSEIKAKQQTVITQTVIEYRDRVKVIHDKADPIQQDIQEHVGKDDPILPGWVRHDFDAAAAGCDVSSDTAGAPCSAYPVATTTLTDTATKDLIICRVDQARLAELQKLVASLAAPAPK